jgi:hypothetical protein
MNTPISRITGAAVSLSADGDIELTLDFGIRREFVLSPELAAEIAKSLLRRAAGSWGINAVPLSDSEGAE